LGESKILHNAWGVTFQFCRRWPTIYTRTISSLSVKSCWLVILQTKKQLVCLDQGHHDLKDMNRAILLTKKNLIDVSHESHQEDTDLVIW
jgi:hypothetical protein